MQPEDVLRIDTPEQITLELPIAGIGSRFLAVAVDTLLQALLFVTIVLALLLSQALPVVQSIGPAMATLFAFCVYWGYFAFFEIIWSGRTPGKRLAGVRVIKESGRPLNAYEAIGRNVLRAIDFLPGLYATGVVVMMLNRHSRRIGDYVAGTVVVYDAAADALGPEWQDRSAALEPGAPLPHVTAEDVALIETYLARRFDLDAVVHEEMGEQIERRITKKIGVSRDESQSVDEFLEGVARRVRDSARFR